MWMHVLFAALLLLVSGSLLLRHRSVWHHARTTPLEPRERDYLLRQYRRRMQTSSIIGIIGLMILGGIWIRGNLWMSAYWGVAILLVLWMGLLALLDLASTRFYFRESHAAQQKEQAALYEELERIKARDGNGRAS